MWLYTLRMGGNSFFSQYFLIIFSITIFFLIIKPEFIKQTIFYLFDIDTCKKNWEYLGSSLSQ
jgi:hypothetical protein